MAPPSLGGILCCPLFAEALRILLILLVAQINRQFEHHKDRGAGVKERKRMQSEEAPTL